MSESGAAGASESLSDAWFDSRSRFGRSVDGVVGLGGGKLTLFGTTPVNIQVGASSYVVSPDGGPDWQFRAQIVLLFPE